MAKTKNKPTVQLKQKTKPVTPPTEEAVIETVVQEENPVNMSQMTTKNAVGQTRSSLDANHRVDLLGLAHKVFKEDPDAGRKYSLDFLDAMDSVIAAGIVSALADEAAFGEGSFSVVLQHKLYPQLVLAAKEMGVTLPTPKNLLPAEDGTVTVNKEQIKLSKEVKEELKNEKAIENEQPELDPKKVAEMDEEALRKALTYIMITGPKATNVKNTLVKIVDFMREYRMTLADKAENAAEAKLKYDDYTTGQWLDDAFSFIKPTFLISGIGRGMTTNVAYEKTPISAFCILRKNMTDKDGNVEWDDQSIADAAKSMIIFVAKDNIEKEKKGLDALDKKAKDYKDVAAKYEASIRRYEDCIETVKNPSFSVIDHIIEGLERDDETLKKMYYRVRDAYYKGKSRDMIKNLDTNVIQHAGIILNMFREPGTQNIDYNVANLSELVQYTEEELKEKAKAELEAKNAEKKAEAKND